MIILSQGDDVTFGGDFEAAAATDFDVGALEFGEERAVALEHGHVETVAVGIPDQHVSSVGDVDAVREIGDVLATDASQKLTVLEGDGGKLELNDVIRQTK